MRLETRVQALEFVLACVLDGHPNRRLALTQIDGLIAEMQVNAETSMQLQVADPLRRAVEAIRAELKT
ncbi:hypothetical protein [Methylibium petroleiphilum]